MTQTSKYHLLQTKVTLSQIYHPVINSRWRLENSCPWDASSTKPGCCPCRGESFSSDHHHSRSSLLQGLLWLLPATHLPNVWCCLSAHHSHVWEGLCPSKATQGGQGSHGWQQQQRQRDRSAKWWAANWCQGAPASALAAPLCLGHLLPALCSEVIIILFF